VWERQPKWGKLPEGDEEAVVDSALLALRVLCDLRVEVLLLCGVAVAREKAKGGKPVDNGYATSGRVTKCECIAAGNWLAKA
jgi:hypothetical protein